MENEIFNIADNEGYNVVSTTTGRNGYPQNVHHAITGFDSWEEMERFRSEHKDVELEPYTIFQKYGWDMWAKTCRADHDLDESAVYDDRETITAGQYADINEFFEEEVKPVLEAIEEFDVAEECLDSYRKVWDELEDLKDDEVAIMADGAIMVQCIAKRHTMSFDYDSARYTIGLMLA